MRLAINFLKAALAASCLAIAACGGTNSTGSPSAPSGVAAVESVLKATAVSTASPDGTTIPSATKIIDASGNVWTVSSGVVYEHGTLAGYSKNVTLLLYENKLIYQQNSAGGWWSWNGSSWVSTSDPPAVSGLCGTTNGMAVTTIPVANLCSAGAASTVSGTGPWRWSCGGRNGGTTASCSATVAAPVVVASPNGTTIPSATKITDSSGKVWTVSGGVVYANGALVGYSKNVTLLLYDNNIIYQQNSAGGWWSWTGSTWQSTNDPVTGTAKLTISGSPPNLDVAGTAYRFVPTTTNPGGGTLSFSITYMPAWASFSKVTGALTGTPSSGQTGAYSNILISASNGSESASLAAFSITVTTGAASLSWTKPTKNTDGTLLTDLAGYKISYGTSPSALSHTIQMANPTATSYVVSNLSAGTYYFAVAAYTSTGTQSAQSSVASKTIL